MIYSIQGGGHGLETGGLAHIQRHLPAARLLRFNVVGFQVPDGTPTALGNPLGELLTSDLATRHV